MIEALLFYSLFTIFNTILPANVQKNTGITSMQNNCVNERCSELEISY